MPIIIYCGRKVECIEREIDSAQTANDLQQKSEGSKISSMSVRTVFVLLLLLFSAKYTALIL
jgi:hypothetical protein